VIRKSRLSWHKQSRLIEHFVAGTTARCTADLIGVNRKTSAYYYHRLRVLISERLEQESAEFLGGEIEVDESYFGGRRKGKRGRGAAGKVFSSRTWPHLSLAGRTALFNTRSVFRVWGSESSESLHLNKNGISGPLRSLALHCSFGVLPEGMHIKWSRNTALILEMLASYFGRISYCP